MAHQVNGTGLNLNLAVVKNEARTQFDPFEEMGTEGINSFYGHVSEPYIQKLHWPQAYKVYDEMRRRDPTLRSILNAVKLLARQAAWSTEPASDSDGDRRAADHLLQCWEDMSHTVADFLDDAFTFLPFGWSNFEICYKRREGQAGQYPSEYDDGQIGWRKFAFRRQSSFCRWEFDENGGLAGWWQMAAPDYIEVFLPIGKLLHLVAERDGQNPEGMALFESAYEAYHFVTNLQIINGIGWQRTFVGLPVFEFESRPSDDDLAVVKRVGQRLQVDEQAYVRVPPGVSFRLESTTNSGAQSLLETIKFYRILMTQMVLADFIFLGIGDTGSWALGTDKTEIFMMAVNGFVRDRIVESINRHAVRRLFEFVRFPGMTGLPKLVASKIHKPNLGELGAFIAQIANFITLGDEDQVWIRQQAGMPVVEAEEAGEVEPEPEPEPEPEMVGLVQLAEPEARADWEAQIRQVFERLLQEQRARVEEAAEQRRNVGEDDAFWEAETTAMRAAAAARLLPLINELGEQAIQELLDEFALAVDWSLVNAEAVDWARNYAGELIAGINDTTRATVRATVAEWIESGGPLSDLRKTLTPTFGRARAERIAATEVTRAFSTVKELTWQKSGFVSGWRWLTVQDELVCPICGPLHDQVFALGEGPEQPAHVKCRCNKAAVIEVPE